MSRAGEEPSHEDIGELSERAVDWIKHLRSYSYEVAGGLRGAWHSGPGVIRKEEGLTLLAAVVLYQQCRRTLAAPGLPPAPEPDLLTAISPVAEIETRYEIEAALRTIPELAPPVVKATMYGAGLRIPQTTKVGSYRWSDELREQAPEVVGEWHDWIWSSHRYANGSVRQAELSDEALRDYGDSSLLALAAGQLSTSITAILGDDYPSM
jgi:hypothetical protein